MSCGCHHESRTPKSTAPRDATTRCVATNVAVSGQPCPRRPPTCWRLPLRRSCRLPLPAARGSSRMGRPFLSLGQFSVSRGRRLTSPGGGFCRHLSEAISTTVAPFLGMGSPVSGSTAKSSPSIRTQPRLLFCSSGGQSLNGIPCSPGGAMSPPI